jgi:hypothetical protein
METAPLYPEAGSTRMIESQALELEGLDSPALIALGVQVAGAQLFVYPHDQRLFTTDQLVLNPSQSQEASALSPGELLGLFYNHANDSVHPYAINPDSVLIDGHSAVIEIPAPVDLPLLLLVLPSNTAIEPATPLKLYSPLQTEFSITVSTFIQHRHVVPATMAEEDLIQAEAVVEAAPAISASLPLTGEPPSPPEGEPVIDQLALDSAPPDLIPPAPEVDADLEAHLALEDILAELQSKGINVARLTAEEKISVSRMPNPLLRAAYARAMIDKKVILENGKRNENERKKKLPPSLPMKKY